MFLSNQHPDYRRPLDAVDAETLGLSAADEVERFLSHRENHAETPLHALPSLAAELGLGAIHIKDEGLRLGLGSFKALGGSYAVIRLVLEEASRRLGRTVDIEELKTPQVRAVAAQCLEWRKGVRQIGGTQLEDWLRSHQIFEAVRAEIIESELGQQLVVEQ